MYTLYLHDNFNGKFFSDHFTHVTVADAEFYEGAEMNLRHRGTELGIIKVEALRSFPFSELSDVVSLINTGKPVQFQASLLNREHNGGKTLDRNTLLQHIVFSYVQRNLDAQNDLIEEWWNEKKVNALL